MMEWVLGLHDEPAKTSTKGWGSSHCTEESRVRFAGIVVKGHKKQHSFVGQSWRGKQ